MIVEENGIRFGPAATLGVASEAVAAFYAANWPRPIALALPSFYRWQFVDPPENGGQDLNCVAVRGESEILGVMGLNRRSFWLDGARVEGGAELTTWVVAKAARGLGVGRGIMASLQASHALMVGFGISEAAMPIYTQAGFRHLRYIPRYFRIFDMDAVRAHVRTEPFGERLATRWPSGPRPAFDAEPAGPEALGACEPAMRSRTNLYTRDGASLAWRYGRHPVYSYECHVVRAREGGGSGVAIVLRREEAPLAGGLRFLHVVDCFGDDRDMPAAVAFAEEAARAHGAAFVDVYCAATALARHFLAAGWFSTNDDYFFQLSHLFYPPEFRTPQTTSAVFWAREGAWMSGLLDLGRIHFAKGDLDLDRPTLAYYDAHGIAAH